MKDGRFLDERSEQRVTNISEAEWGAGAFGVFMKWLLRDLQGFSILCTAAAMAAMLAGCAATAGQRSSSLTPTADADVPAASVPAQIYPSTYEPPQAATVALVGATVLDGTGRQLEAATVVMRDGRIASVGVDVQIPADAHKIDATGLWVTPGIIDIHSHLGLAPSPITPANNDSNEFSDPNTAEVMAEHSIWPQDPAFARALSGGVTTLQILPGSTNLFGGRSVVLKNVRARTVQEMKMPGAPYGFKMACGENPKHVYGARGRAPITRMASFALYRSAWIKAADYRRKRSEHEAGKGPAPVRDLELEALADVLSGDALLHVHCYRADEMAQMLDLAAEFGFRITSFQHALEAYKIPDLLTTANVCVATWFDTWGYKMESYDGVPENAAMVHAAGGCAIVHSDSDFIIQRLNQEAAKSMFAGRNAGLDITRGEAWRWISLNPARALGIDAEVGSLEPGKAADVVLWDGDPFSVYTRARKVWIDGVLRFDDEAAVAFERTDFELGQPGQGDMK